MPVSVRMQVASTPVKTSSSRVAVLIAIIIIIITGPSLYLYDGFAQGTLTASTNQKAYSGRDTLVVFGKSLPNDSLTAQLFKPNGREVLREPIQAGPDGTFAEILMEWPITPDNQFTFGTYTLTITSGKERDLRTNLVFTYTNAPTQPAGQSQRLELEVSVPSVIGINETAKIVIEVSMNGILQRGTQETLKDSWIFYPDSRQQDRLLKNFDIISDGIYLADFSSQVTGHHIISIQASQQGLVANKAVGVFVEEGSILSLGKEISRVNDNLVQLREETRQRNEDLSNAVSRVSDAAGQVSSLLLPVIGMIVVVVVLQATMLSRRGKPVTTPAAAPASAYIHTP